MAEKKSILKTVVGNAVGSAYNRVAENMPNPTRGLYNLGLGIGPAIQAAATNFSKTAVAANDGTQKETKEAIQAANKTAAQGYKSITAALSSMNRILDDIRKINVAQLTLQTKTASQQQIQKNRQAYTDIETMLETMRPDVSGTTKKELADKKESGGMLSSIFSSFLSGGLGTKLGLGALALVGLANADKIKEFTKTFLTAAGYDPATIQKNVEQYLKDTAKDIGKFAVDTVKAAVSEVGKLIITGITSQTQQIKDAYKTGSTQGGVVGGIQEANRKVIAPDIGGVAGFAAGFRLTPGGLVSKTIGGTAGAIGGVALAEENPELVTGGAIAASGLYGYSKYRKFKAARAPKVTPTASAGGMEPPKGPWANVDKMSAAERRALIKEMNTAEKASPGFKRTAKAIWDGVKKGGTRFMSKLAARLGPRAAAAAAPILSSLAVPGWGEVVAFLAAIIGAGFTIYEIYDIVQNWDMEDYDEVFPKNVQAVPGKSEEDLAIEEIINKSENKAPVTSFDYGPSTREVANQVAGVTPVTPLSLTASTQTPFDKEMFKSQTAMKESGGDYNIANKAGTSSAFGKYQFTKGTFESVKGSASDMSRLKTASWEDFKNSPQMQEYAMDLLTDINYKSLCNGLGREPTQEEMYMAHFLGANTAVQLILNKDNDVPIRNILKNGQIEANQSMFKNVTTTKQAYAAIGGYFGGQGGAASSSSLIASASMPSSLFTPEQMETMGINQEDVKALESLQTQVSGFRDIAGQVLAVLSGSGTAQAAPTSRESPPTITALNPSAPEKDKLTGYINGFALKPAASFR